MKTRKQKFIRLLLAGLIPVLALFSCIKEREIGGGTTAEGESVVRFSVRLPGASHASRSLSGDDESHVQTIDILMFEQGGGVWKYKAGVSGAAIATDDLDAAKKTFTITMRHGDYDLVMLANAREKIVALDLASKTKSQVLAALTEDVSAGDKWPADGSRPIPMWGEIDDITIDGSTEITEADGVTLTRMVARVDVVIAPTVDNFTITSVDVYNYNTKGSLAPLASAWNPLADPPRATAPNVPAGSVLTKGPLEYNNEGGKSEINTIDNECASEIYIFESENHTGAGHAAGKDHLDLTCIVVGGVYGTDADPTYYRADFSTGTGDAETFLDVIRNHHYTFTITKVNGPGYATSEEAFQGAKPIEFTVSVTDWGAETHFPLGLEIKPSSNCYLVAPGETFAIPVFGQVQRAMDARHLDDKWITNDMDLKAYLVWCDNEDVNGVVSTSRLKVSKSSLPANTILRVETGDRTGNAVVAVYYDKDHDGIYNNADEIKWSWHIWVTDYDPDKQINGTTHVYAGNAFTNPLGIYYNGGNPKRIMDRNLGATWTAADGADIGATMTTTSPAPTAEKAAKAYGLLYQWGRKDPFPGATSTGGEPTLHNGSGTVSITPTPAASNFSNTVKNPMTFYYNPTPPSDWYTTGGTQNNNLWCEDGIMSIAGSKTVYDPCPPGWRVPLGGTTATNNPWTGISNGIANSTASVTGLGIGAPAIFPWYTNGSVSTTITNATNGRYYNEIAWYPASGQRYFSNGVLSYVGRYGCNWGAATTETYGYRLNFTNTDLTPVGATYRALGLSVRCVQE